MIEIAKQFLWVNKDWIFSGIGVFILATIVSFIMKGRPPENNISQNQKSGDNSTAIQIGKIERPSKK